VSSCTSPSAFALHVLPSTRTAYPAPLLLPHHQLARPRETISAARDEELLRVEREHLDHVDASGQAISRLEAED